MMSDAVNRMGNQTATMLPVTMFLVGKHTCIVLVRMSATGDQYQCEFNCQCHTISMVGGT
jgi:hypothetical protein